MIPQGGTLIVANSDGGSIRVRGDTSAVILIAVGSNYQIGNPQVFSATDRLEKLRGFPHLHK